jgi:NhaP-type Na+/H+ or K+/H+ antiporter
MGYRTTFRNGSDLASALALPVVAVMPAMETPQERRARKRRRLIVLLLVVALIVLVGGAVAAWFLLR